MIQPETPATEPLESAAMAAMSAYGIDAIHDPPVRQGGAVNHVLLVATERKDVIIRIYRPETTPERLEAVHHVQGLLRSRGLPIPHAYLTRTGASWTRVDGRLVEALEYVLGGHEVETWGDGRRVFTALGQLHAVLRTVDGSRLPPPVHAWVADPETASALLEAKWEVFPALAGAPGFDDAVSVRRATADLLRRLGDAWKTYQASIPQSLVHGDFVGNNVLLSRGEVVAILDFDRMDVGHRLYEVAYTLTSVLSRLVRTGQRWVMRLSWRTSSVPPGSHGSETSVSRRRAHGGRAAVRVAGPQLVYGGVRMGANAR